MSEKATRERRRLDEKPDPGPRAGCIMTGAILGIVVGAIFAFYGLPPLLRSFYGETRVDFGETYRGDARMITVLSSERSDDEYVLEVRIRSNKTWDTGPADWKLEISTQRDWIEAKPADLSDPDTSFDFPLGVERTLLLRFPATTRVDTELVALHLADPHVRFDLQPPDSP
jgi:hypothetical protein